MAQRLTRTAVGMLLLGMVAGCSSTQVSGASSGLGVKPTAQPSVTATATGTDMNDVSLPIETYLFTLDQLNQLNQAEFVLVRKCMASFDITYTITPSAQNETDFGTYGMRRRYGVPYSEQDAAIDGFGISPTDITPTESLYKGLNTAEASVLSGLQLSDGSSGQYAPNEPATSYQGKAIPSSGCMGQAQREIAGSQGSSFGQTPVASQIKADSFQYSQSDTRVLAAFKAWSQCMAQSGFDYATPIAAATDSRWGTGAPSALEVTTAETSYSCAAKTNVVGIWASVEGAYETTEINKNIQALQAEAEQRNADMEKVAAVLSGSD